MCYAGGDVDDERRAHLIPRPQIVQGVVTLRTVAARLGGPVLWVTDHRMMVSLSRSGTPGDLTSTLAAHSCVAVNMSVTGSRQRRRVSPGGLGLLASGTKVCPLRYCGSAMTCICALRV